jgi:HrpA-like RNA helicase
VDIDASIGHPGQGGVPLPLPDRPVRPSLVTRSSHLVASEGLARMLAAERPACLPEMLIIASGLSIQDRERPGRNRDATTRAGDESLILVAAYSDSVEGRPKRLDDRDCLTPTALRRLHNQSTAT